MINTIGWHSAKRRIAPGQQAYAVGQPKILQVKGLAAAKMKMVRCGNQVRLLLALANGVVLELPPDELLWGCDLQSMSAGQSILQTSWSDQVRPAGL